MSHHPSAGSERLEETQPRVEHPSQRRAFGVFLDSLESHLKLRHIAVISFLFVVASAWVMKGGVAHPEICYRLPYHLLGSKPFLQRTFNVAVQDYGMYQNRELSYLFDAIDCYFISVSVIAGIPHFLSLTYYVFAVAIGVLLWLFSVRDLRLDRLSAALLVLVFYTSTSVFLSVSYFRSSKIGVALAAVVFCFLLHRALTDKVPPLGKSTALRRGFFLFAAGLFGTQMDRQGFFMLGCAVVFICIRIFVFGDRRGRLPLAAGLLALLLSACCNYVIVPQIYLFLGRPVSFAYQNLPWGTLIRNPTYYLANGTLLLVDTCRFTFGNWSAVHAAILMALAAWALTSEKLQEPQMHSVRNSRGSHCKTAFTIAVMFGLAIVMNALMFLRHYPLIWPDVRRVYYWLPMASLLTVIASLSLKSLNYSLRIPRRITQCVLALLLIGNIAAIPENLLVLRSGFGKAVYELSPRLLQGLRRMGDPSFVPSPDVRDNPIYQHFQETRP